MPNPFLKRFVLLSLLCGLFLGGCNETDLVGELDGEDWSEGLNLPEADFTPAERLEVVTWTDYIPDDVFALFEKTYGTRVEPTLVGSNEDMLERFEKKPGRFDVLTASDYMVAVMIGKGLLHGIDHAHFSNVQSLDEDMLRVWYDRGLRHSIPLFRISLGVAFNIKYVSGIPRSWDYLHEQVRNEYLAFRFGIVGEMRFAMGMALILDGHSPNSRDPAEIAAAGDRLVHAVEHYGMTLFGADAGDRALADNDVLLALTWNGLGAEVLKKNTDIRFLLPEGQVLVAYDNLVIAAESRRVRTAELFIDFLLTPQVMAHVTNYNHFPNSNSLSMPFVEPIVRNGPGYLLPDEENRQFLQDVGESIRYYEAAWKRVLEADPLPSLVKLPLPRDGFFRGGTAPIDFAKDLKRQEGLSGAGCDP
ncbi:polyamine ABC transporter substrate-binding protein [Imhoffiella purpurea]|uniref:Putrescine-binding periplasmic protein n=1 Tax=Imhoffiella purpurea TaxID=1249627 RepID=W9UVF7_9GAMM|nr:spermidine/putrescine ABC transporter substrate-binding protein [Imhoffiella purpurea]EXJ11069.1 hypothetical protein D779_0240 [Imhoffiella purpurea]